MVKVLVNFSLDGETAKMLDDLSKEYKISKSKVIRELIKNANLKQTFDFLNLEEDHMDLVDLLTNPVRLWKYPTNFIIQAISSLFIDEYEAKVLHEKNPDDVQYLKKAIKRIVKGFDDCWCDNDDYWYHPNMSLDEFVDAIFNQLCEWYELRKDLLLGKEKIEECSKECFKE